MNELQGRKVAILVAKGFEQDELAQPKRALEEAGAKAMIISPEKGPLRAWKYDDWGDAFEVDMPLSEANPDDFDALVLPGGVINPDRLRLYPEAIRFIRAFFDAAKPVAAVCHGPWTLIDAGVVYGRRVTSWPSLKTDLKNAGAHWVDQEVVVDSGLVTSRKPDDLPAFNRKLIEEIHEGIHVA